MADNTAMNRYETKQEERRERLLDAADRAEDRSTQHGKSADRIMDAIPMGQPVLVGHHSEKRHRRDLNRLDRHMAGSVGEQQKAQDLRRKADAIGSAGVSSDDPDAVVKLREKLAELENERDAMKAINKAFKKGGAKALAEFHPDMVARGLQTMQVCQWEKRPFPPYAISNIGANIRRVKQRIDALKAAAVAPEREAVEGDGWRICEDRDENRVCIEFEAKPDAAIRSALKSRGFRWNRTLGSWTRQLNGSAWHAACDAMGAI